MSTATEPPQAPMRNELLAGRQRAAWLFLSPMMLVLAIVAAYPLLLTIWFSFTDASLLHLPDAKWVGFKNYFRVLHTDSGATTLWRRADGQGVVGCRVEHGAFRHRFGDA